MTARDILSARNAGPGAFRLDPWLRRHRGARLFVEEWVKMRAEGTSDWGARRVVRYLREKYDCPLRDSVSLLRWCEQRFPNEYRRGIAA